MSTKKITFSSTQMKELRQLYGSYKQLNSDYFDTKEEYFAAKKEAREEIENKMIELGRPLNSIYEIENIIYSKNQLRFIADAEQTEFDVDYSYSGRGMFGDCCPAIRCHSHNDITTRATKQIDSMGRGIVIYAQH